MKTYQKLNRFPLGAIHAEGFLKQQMEIGKNGMTGHLYELEPDMYGQAQCSSCIRIAIKHPICGRCIRRKPTSRLRIISM